MKRLFTMDMKDYDLSFSRFIRPTLRAVIICCNKVAMVYSKKFDYYKFPGGGIENTEDKMSALKREVLEETGLSVIDDSINELGSVLRIQTSRFAENEIFEQENFYYFCRVNSNISSQSLDQYESDEGFTLEFVTAEHAISVNRFNDHSDYDKYLIEREARVLEYLLEKDYL